MENYFTDLYAKNIGFFEELKVSFNPTFNLIVGPNSSGKTSLLKCIALSLNPREASKIRYGDSSMVWVDSLLGSTKYRIGLGEGWVMDQGEYRNAKISSWKEPPSAPGIVSITASGLDRKDINVAPLLLGAYRRIEYVRIEGMKREPNISQQRQQYRNSSFTNLEGGTLPNVKQWMINRYFEIEKDWAKIYKDNWTWIMQNLRKICPTNIKLDFKEIKRDLEPVFTFNGSECYLEEISAGFQAILSLIFEIVEWIEGTNEENEAYIPDATGVVIIDELDVHLHPEWQLTIRSALRTVFPKLQFIVTTHSPHLIATVEPGELIILPGTREVDVRPTDQTYSGWNTDQILEDVMGVKSLENKLYATALNEALDQVEKRDINALKISIEKLQSIVHPSNTILEVLQIKLAQLELGDRND
nr:AAA family ATPase [uncultured Oscillibacter sp.]